MLSRECVYCGVSEHRTWRCTYRRRTDWIAVCIYLGWAAVIIVLATAIAGCSVTVAPDTLCQTGRPRAATNDTAETRAAATFMTGLPTNCATKRLAGRE